MGKTNNILELNGKRYDAVTGALLGETAGTAAKHIMTAKPKTHPVHRGVAVDGIVRPGTLAATNLAPIPVHPAPAAPKKSTMHAVKPLPAHKPTRSKTLMRHVVKAPKIEPKKALKVQAPTDLIKKQPAVLAVKPKLSSDQIDDARADRAKQVPRNGAVQRFSNLRTLRELQANKAAATRPHATPARTLDGIRAGRPRAEQHPSSLFEQAITAARSHEQVRPKESSKQKARRGVRKHMHMLSISTAVATLLLLGGFIAYQNKANLELQVASAKAGFHISMPGYKPRGYAVKGFSYSPGVATIGFASDRQTYTVTQKASNWDSQTLLENFVATSGESYKTYNAAGRTVYVYSSGDATWVNGGVWYQVNGTASLSNDQIIHIATSM